MARTRGAPPIKRLKNIVYSNQSGMVLDLYPAAQQAHAPAPTVVYVHGGAWTTGNKNGGYSLELAPAITERGGIFVALNYRLAPEFLFPAHIQDVKCAIRFLRAHAVKYGIDPQRIAIIGNSAGGHLVSLAGLTDASAGFDTDEYAHQSSQVQAVVDLYGPADLTPISANSYFQRRLRAVFGRDPDALRRASPVTYIKAGAPPFFIVHGERDQTVPIAQSVALQAALQAVGGQATLLSVRNAGHALVSVGGPISPSQDQINAAIVEWLSAKLQFAGG